MKDEHIEARPVMRDLSRPPLTIARIEAIPVALPLAKPMKMAGETIAQASNIIVRVEAADGTVGWGEAASALATSVPRRRGGVSAKSSLESHHFDLTALVMGSGSYTVTSVLHPAAHADSFWVVSPRPAS